MSIIKILFIGSLIAFPLGQFARVQLPDNIAVTFLDVFVFSTVLFWLIRYVTHKQQTTSSLIKPLAIFLLLCVLSLIVNLGNYELRETVVSFLYLFRYTIYACLFLVIRDFDSDFRQKIPTYLTVTGLSVVLIGFLQYFFYPDLRNLYYLGWDEHLYRMFASFFDPNFAGAFFVLYLFFIAGQILEKQIKPIRRERMVFVGIAFLTLLGVVLTYSRSSMLMLLAGAFVFFIISKNKKLVVLTVLLFFLLVVILSNLKIEGLNPFRIASSTARIDSAEQALSIIQKNPVFGIGFNAYRYALQRYGLREAQSPIQSHADAGTDNSFLFVLATTGLVGLAGFLYFLATLLSYAYTRMRSNSKTAVVVFVSVVALLFDSLFINSLFFPMLLYWLWIMIGLMEST